MFKYLVVCPIEGEALEAIKRIMSVVSPLFPAGSQMAKSIPPHITLCSPVVDVNEKGLGDVVAGAICGSGPHPVRDVWTGDGMLFGQEFFVLPIQGVPWCIAGLWVEMYRRVMSLPHIEPGLYDRENILHVTLLEGLTGASEDVRSSLLEMKIRPVKIRLPRVEIYRKFQTSGSKWELREKISFLGESIS